MATPVDVPAPPAEWPTHMANTPVRSLTFTRMAAVDSTVTPLGGAPSRTDPAATDFPPRPGAIGLVERASQADAARLVVMVGTALKAAAAPPMLPLVQRVAAGLLTPDTAVALTHQPDHAVAVLLAAFPGPLLQDAFGHDAPLWSAAEMSPVAASLKKLGGGAASLAVALGDRHAGRDARLVAVQMAQHASSPGVVTLVARRLGDTDPRVAYAAALMLQRLMGVKDGRVVEARRAITLLASYLARGVEWQRAAALRAASIIPDAAFVGPLVGLLSTGNAAEAMAALRDITCLDLPRARDWVTWWEDHGPKPRRQWLLDALEQQSPAQARAALRALEQDTGHQEGHSSMDTRAIRRDMHARWVAWLGQTQGAA